MVEQPEAVLGRVPVGERLAVELGVAEPALVPRDDPVRRRERVALGIEHLVIHQEAVGEDHGGAIASAVLKADPLAVDLRVWHGASNQIEGSANLSPRARPWRELTSAQARAS